EKRQHVVEILAGPYLIDLDALSSGGRSGNRRQGVVVTGNAGRLFPELWSDVEHSGDASGHGDSRIGDTAFRGRRDLLAPRTIASSRAVLFQHLDLRAVALVDRPIERRFTFRRPGVRVGAVFEQ